MKKCGAENREQKIKWSNFPSREYLQNVTIVYNFGLNIGWKCPKVNI